MKTATIKGMRDLAEKMRANGTKIVRTPGGLYEVRRDGRYEGVRNTLAGAEELASAFSRAKAVRS
jgi:hypothetical protein